MLEWAWEIYDKMSKDKTLGACTVTSSEWETRTPPIRINPKFSKELRSSKREWRPSLDDIDWDGENPVSRSQSNGDPKPLRSSLKVMIPKSYNADMYYPGCSDGKSKSFTHTIRL